MSQQLTVLTDADERIWLESFRVQAQSDSGRADTLRAPSIEKWTIHGGPGDGVDVVAICVHALGGSCHLRFAVQQ